MFRICWATLAAWSMTMGKVDVRISHSHPLLAKLPRVPGLLMGVKSVPQKSPRQPLIWTKNSFLQSAIAWLCRKKRQKNENEEKVIFKSPADLSNKKRVWKLTAHVPSVCVCVKVRQSNQSSRPPRGFSTPHRHRIQNDQILFWPCNKYKNHFTQIPGGGG